MVVKSKFSIRKLKKSAKQLIELNANNFCDNESIIWKIKKVVFFYYLNI